MWLTKAVDIAVSLLVHVVAYAVPSLRRPPVLLVHYRVMRVEGNCRQVVALHADLGVDAGR